MQRVLLALTHVASQLLYRWLPPPPVGRLDAELLADACGVGDDPSELEAADWRAVLRWCVLEAPGLVAWFPNYARVHGDPDGSALARWAASHFSALRAAQGRYLTIDDPGYPELLRRISDPPLGLSVLGDELCLRGPAVAVVGSRKASALAMRESHALGRDLAAAGFVVVSGGAFGCDIAAHLGVLTSGTDPSPAVAVFAGGLESVYPRAHAHVFERLRRRRAALVSERLWSAYPRPLDFPIRNRIIAGLAPLLVVMQAARKSGAMITARQALDQGRDVGVLMHPPGDVRASGSAQLLAEGAVGFASAAECLEHALAAHAALTKAFPG
jgi:DNA processing protein